MEHKPTWKLEKLYPGVYHLQFTHRYDTTMHFLRYQEHYESQSPEFRGQFFTLLEYQEWYAKTQCPWKRKKSADGTVSLTKTAKEQVYVFSYPTDWGGFNVPSYVFDNLNSENIPDWNKYDKFMHAIAASIRAMGDEKFYLIGTTAGPKAESILDHEISHGLFYTLEEYREAASDLYYHKAPTEVCVALREWLVNDQGYHETVVVDETIAYLATGLKGEEFKKNPKFAACVKARGPFQRLFKKTVAGLQAG